MGRGHITGLMGKDMWDFGKIIIKMEGDYIPGHQDKYMMVIG
jgi:hypothetical protein